MIIALSGVAAIVATAVLFMMYNKIIPLGMGIHKPVYQVENVALAGYDATTYFTGAPQKGTAEFESSYKDVRWYFVSKENRDAFESDPERYVPQFGGYCARAVSAGFAAPADPAIYSIYQDKLFIFNNEDVKRGFPC